jgi:hypothetical protein
VDPLKICLLDPDPREKNADPDPAACRLVPKAKIRFFFNRIVIKIDTREG